MDASNPDVLINPRICGVYEQYSRAQWFVQSALVLSDVVTRFRLLIAAIYPARAIVELMLEAAEKQELKTLLNSDGKKSRKAFEETLMPVLPYYHLIEKIRIHDFHRFGCIPPDPKVHMVFYGGPITLVANQGAAVFSIPSEGPKVTWTGNSRIKEQRPLCIDDGQFFDEDSGSYLLLENILDKYLTAMPPIINQFERLLSGQ